MSIDDMTREFVNTFNNGKNILQGTAQLIQSRLSQMGLMYESLIREFDQSDMNDYWNLMKDWWKGVKKGYNWGKNLAAQQTADDKAKEDFYKRMKVYCQKYDQFKNNAIKTEDYRNYTNYQQDFEKAWQSAGTYGANKDLMVKFYDEDIVKAYSNLAYLCQRYSKPQKQQQQNQQGQQQQNQQQQQYQQGQQNQQYNP